MSIPGGYFRKQFASLAMDKVGDGYKLRFNVTGLGERIDQAQDALDAQVWNDVQQYMPIDTGNLKMQTNMLNVSTRGEVYMYDPALPYGHYQYEGIKYVDPLYGIGAFYDPEYGFWSRPNVKKVPSGEPLHYSNPKAEAHWGEVAFNNHKESWLNVVRSFIE